MPAKKYPSTVEKIEHHGSGVHTLYIKSNTGRYRYFPGQFLHLALDEDYDGIGQWPDSRCFSIQGSVDNKQIKLSFAVKGSYTKQMETCLKPGSKVWLKLPYGDLFTQQHAKENTVFISGGTGITPFLSLFTHPSFSEYKAPVLYAGFKNAAMDFYHQELNNSIRINPHFRINKVFEDVQGLLDIDMILKDSHENSCFFLSGPPAMINTFRNALLLYGVQDSHIISDEWN